MTALYQDTEPGPCTGCVPGTLGHALANFPDPKLRPQVPGLHSHPDPEVVAGLHSPMKWNPWDGVEDGQTSTLGALVFRDEGDPQGFGLGIEFGEHAESRVMESAIEFAIYRDRVAEYADGGALHAEVAVDLGEFEVGLIERILAKTSKEWISEWFDAKSKVTTRPAVPVIGVAPNRSGEPAERQPGDAARVTNWVREALRWKLSEPIEDYRARRQLDDPSNPLKVGRRAIKLVLATLAAHCDTQGRTFVGLDTVAELTETTRRNASDAIKALIDLGVITSEGMRRTKGGHFGATVYRINPAPNGGRR